MNALVKRIKKGDTATVPGHDWVDVMNPEGVANGNGFHEFGSSCSIQEGGTITVVGEDSDSGQLLVRYTTPGDQIAYGAPCGSGTLFYISKERFLGMTAQYETKQRERRAQQQRINKLLDQEHAN